MPLDEKKTQQDTWEIHLFNVSGCDSNQLGWPSLALEIWFFEK